MISSPLITALERDEDFLASVLRSAEQDSNLRLDQVELISRGSAVNICLDCATIIHVKGRKGKNLKKFQKTLMIKRYAEQQTRHQTQRDPAFCNEATFYGAVVPTIKQLIGVDHQLSFPTCLHASTNVIVLEDLQSQGHSVCNHRKGLDFDHSVAAIQALARFHAVSFALKHQDHCAFNGVIGQVKEVVFLSNAAPVFGASLESALDLAISALKQCPEQVIFDAVQVLQSIQGRTFRTLVSLVEPKEPLSVICHGDFWINNIMFKYQDEKIQNVILTDFQVVRYSSLATDILYFLYTSLVPGLMRDFNDDLIKIYHKSLNDRIAEISSSAPAVTLAEIYDEIESHALYGLLMSFLVLPNITGDGTVAEPSDSHLNGFTFSLTYSQRVKDIVLEFVEKGFI